MTAKFKVGLVQMSMSADPQPNVDKAAARVEEAARKGAQVVCLPELFRSPVLLPAGGRRALRPRRADPRADHRAARGGGAQGGRRGRRARSSSSARRGSTTTPRWSSTRTARTAGLYRKMHIPDDPLFYEKFYFTPGDLGFQAFDTRFGTDRRRWSAGTSGTPRRARLTALARRRGALLPDRHRLAPGREGEHGAAQRDAWQTMQRGHAIANGCYVAAVNRVGHEPGPAGQAGLEFWGTSFVCDPFGVVHRRGLDRPGGDPGRRDRPRAHRGGAPQLALPARPAHRRLRGHRPAVPRVSPRRDPRSRARPRRPACRPCRRSGSRTTRPGSPGRTTSATGRASSRPSRGSTPRSSAHVARGESVRLLVEDAAHEAKVAEGARPRGRRPRRASSSAASRTDRVWTRDSGPDLRRAARRRGRPIAALPLQRLGQVPGLEERREAARARRAGARRAAPARRARAGGAVVLEGGAIDVNGQGHAPHHRGVPARSRGPGAQPRLRRARTTRRSSRDSLGAPNVIWLGKGIAGDDTHGHVDDLARFVDPRTVVALPRARTRPTPNHAPARGEPRAARGGAARRTARGPRSSSLPMPAPRGLRRPAAAGELRQLLHRQRRGAGADVQRPERPRSRSASSAELFRDRPVVGIHAVDLVWGLGTLHCLTQQEPKVPA